MNLIIPPVDLLDSPFAKKAPEPTTLKLNVRSPAPEGKKEDTQTTTTPRTEAPGPQQPGASLIYCDVPGCARSTSKPFADTCALENHKRDAHPVPATAATEKPHKCKECPESFARQVDLAGHVRTHHRTHPKKSEHWQTIRLTERSWGYKCRHCDFAKFNKLAVITHLAEMHNIHEDAPKAPTPPASASFDCPECAASFNTRPSLSWHFGRAHPGKILRVATDTHECTKCGCTGNYPNLAAHGKRAHASAAGIIVARKVEAPAAPPRLTLPPDYPRTVSEHITKLEKAIAEDKTAQYFITFTGNKADCANVAFLLSEHGFNNIKLGKIKP